jgi:hypothetical protein
MPELNPDTELRCLRNQVARLEDDKAHLEGRLAFAIQETGHLRAKLQAPRPTFQAAVLRRVRPLPLAS